MGYLVSIIGAYFISGVVTIEPNDAVVVTLCGKYFGTIRETGKWYIFPWYSKQKISVKLQNF